MKKLIVLFAFIALTMSSNAADKFQIGIKTGFNTSHFTTSNYNPSGVTINNIQEDAKAGYCLGIYARLPITDKLRFQPELYYNSKNGSSDVTMNNVIKPSNIEVKSWDIPLLLNLKVINLKVIEIYGLGGPVVSFLSNPTTSNFKENYKSAAWNFQAGLGIQVWKINIDTRYEWGLSNLSDGIENNTLQNTTLTRKSNSFQINISYQIF